VDRTSNQPAAVAAIRVDLSAIFISLELSKSSWLVTALLPGSSKMTRQSVPGGDLPAILQCFAGLQNKAHAREGKLYPLIVVQEAGLDGFWIHRALDTLSSLRSSQTVIIPNMMTRSYGPAASSIRITSIPSA